MRAGTEHRSTMFSLIENWQQSGLNQKTFCEQQQIATHQFYYWYKCYRSQKNEVPVIPSPKRFVEVHAHPAPGAAAIEVVLSCGHRIYFNQPVAASFIKALIS